MTKSTLNNDILDIIEYYKKNFEKYELYEKIKRKILTFNVRINR